MFEINCWIFFFNCFFFNCLDFFLLIVWIFLNCFLCFNYLDFFNCYLVIFNCFFMQTKPEVGPRRVGPRRVEPRRVGSPKFRAFFPSSATIFFLLSLSGAPFVEFWWEGRSRGKGGPGGRAVQGEGRSQEGRSKPNSKPTPTHEMKQYPHHSDNTQHNTTQTPHNKSNSIWPKSILAKVGLAKSRPCSCQGLQVGERFERIGRH